MLYIISYKKKRSKQIIYRNEFNDSKTRQHHAVLKNMSTYSLNFIYILYKSSNVIFIAINKKIFINLDWKNKKTFDEKIIGFCF